MIAKGWCLAKLEIDSAEQAILQISRTLLAHGRVRETFGRAAVLRERRSPTGVPFAPPAVALPHVEPDHVLLPTIAVVTLASPVAFREMGSPESTLAVEIVIVPAFSAKEQAAGTLSQLIELLQDDALRRALVSAPDSAALVDLLGSHAWHA